MENRIIIMGATSGLGYATARIFQNMGWKVGVAGRRQDLLDKLVRMSPDNTYSRRIDVTDSGAADELTSMIRTMGGMTVYLHCSGTGSQNMALEPDIELNTTITNVEGFTRMVTAAYRHFALQGNGHIAVISSIAGTKGLGAAPAYSATKRFQNTYMDALEQLANRQKLNMRFTDIRPGFVRTALLNGKQYPMLMNAEHVAEKIAKAIVRKQRRVIIDWRYSVLVAFWRILPSRIWAKFPAFN